MHRPRPISVFLRVLVCAGVFAAMDSRAQQSSVEFVGTKGFTIQELRTAIAEQLIEIEAKGATPARADDAAFFLGGHYRKQGYARVEVKYEVRGKTLVLQVKEGPRALLRSLRFAGNQHVDTANLAQYFAGVPVEGIAQAKIPYTEAEVSAGGDRVRGYYLSEGWLDATVDISGSRLSADGTAADIAVAIVEGTHYTFGEVAFSGGEGYSRDELVNALGAKPEGSFTPSLAETMQGALRSWLRGRGHFGAQVTVEAGKEKASGGRVPVRFILTAGPTFRVSRVEPKGLDRLTPQFIERRFSKITDATYDPAKIDEKYRELLRTGLFRTLHIVPKQEGKDRLRLDLEITEEKSKEFGFELGFGSYEGLIASVRLGDRNFMRSGRPLSLTLETTQRGFTGELLYVDPWFLETDWTLRGRLYSQVRDEEGYSKTAEGLRVELSRKVTSRWELSAFTEFAVTSISSTEIDPVLLGPLSYALGSLGIGQKLDYRDDPLNPRRGFIFTSALEFDTLDGQPAFGRLTMRYSHYRAFGRSLLALGLRAGWIIPVGEAADVPIDLRYFNGGGNSVRSFAERELGPKDTGGHPLGGAFYTVANVEWDFPLTTTLGGAVFIDAGNLKTEASPGLDDLRFAIGLGLRYSLPIGPIRIDYGYNPARHESEDIGAVHFSFGFAF